MQLQNIWPAWYCFKKAFCMTLAVGAKLALPQLLKGGPCHELEHASL